MNEFAVEGLLQNLWIEFLIDRYYGFIILLVDDCLLLLRIDDKELRTKITACYQPKKLICSGYIIFEENEYKLICSKISILE